MWRQGTVAGREEQQDGRAWRRKAGWLGILDPFPAVLFVFFLLVRSPQSRQVHLGPYFERKFSLVFLVCNSGWLWDANQGAGWLEPHSTFGTGFSSCQVSTVLLYHGNSLHVVFDSAIQTKHSLFMWRRKGSSYEPLAENDHTVIQPVQLLSHTSAPLHPGYRDHRGKACKWEAHHSCTNVHQDSHLKAEGMSSRCWFGKSRNMRVDLQVDVVFQWIYPNSRIQGQMQQMILNLDSELCNVCSYSQLVLILISLHFMSFPENYTFGNCGEAILF